MKAIQVTRSGGPEVLQLIDEPTPTAGPGQILIEVKAAGINFSDIVAREGHYPPAPPPPFVPGYEAAGLVSAVGEGVTGWSVGDRVLSVTSGNCTNGYAEYAVVDAAGAAPLPDSVGFAEATALLIQGMTAHALLTVAVPEIEGKSVLITGAAGGVGSLLVQIAKLLGAGTIIGLASTEDKRATVKALGADEAIDYTQDGWREQVKAATGGKGVDIYLDATGDSAGGVKTLAEGGYWVVYGAQATSETALTGRNLTEMIFGGQTIRGWNLYLTPRDVLEKTLKTLIAWTADGTLKVTAEDRFPLADAAKAHQAIEGRKTSGKVVLEP